MAKVLENYQELDRILTELKISSGIRGCNFGDQVSVRGSLKAIIVIDCT